MTNNITCLKKGRVIDPANGIDEVKDLYFQNGKFIEKISSQSLPSIKIINLEGKILFPGLIDLRCHLKKNA